MRAISLGIQFAALAVVSLASDNVSASLRQQLAASNITLVVPGDAAYANASKPYNLRFSFKPVAVAYPTTPQEVSAVVKAGASLNLNVAARSGGHSYIANGLGGKNGSLVVDLSKMKNITYDPSTGLAVIQTGNRLGDIALVLNEYGRGLPHGRCAYVGIGGHSGYGGFGYIGRMWGLTLDTIRSATIVLADGSIKTISEVQNPELFWAVRGSSPSFGIVTSIQVQTFAAPDENSIYLYQWDLSVEEATNALASWQNFTGSPDLPVEYGGEVLFLKGSAPGRVGVTWFGGYYGPFVSYNATVQPFLDTFPSDPAVTSVTQGDWLTGLNAVSLGVGPLNTSTQEDSSSGFYAKSLMTPEEEPMTLEAMSAVVDYLGNVAYYSDYQWDIEVELFGGPKSAITSVPLDSTAFAHRNLKFNMQFYVFDANYTAGTSFSEAAFDVLDGMVNAITSNMPADWDIGAYTNYIDNRLPNWQKLYYGPHYDRLHALKKVVDPHSVFHFPITVQ